jgi:hypothetical protein
MSELCRCSCACTEKHSGHLCVLSSQEKEEEITNLTDNPTVMCFICGRKANSADNVCSPMPLV